MSEFLKFKKSNCRNCHKCIRHCPVKSIRFSGNQANVIADECILCGQCYVVCPQDAKLIVDETEIVDVLLKGDVPVVASIAPSFVAYFDGVGINSLAEAVKKLGFFAAEETAIGATFVKREYEQMTKEGIHDVIITSCCHTVNLLIEKYYPQLIGYLAPVKTPMHAHCDDIKRRYQNVKTVFIGPCLSKKDEAKKNGIDAAITFEELEKMFEKAGITLEKEKDENKESRARIFPTCGGVVNTMTEKSPNYTYFCVDGIENCMRVLDDIAAGNIHNCFIEMSSCSGSCIGGPTMEKHRNSLLRNYKAVTDYAGEQDFDVPQPEGLFKEYTYIELKKDYPTDAQISEILRKMGKYKPDDELNCGTCGYNTCREKAIAIYQGKAEITMCLPYLMEKSERFSNNILDNTPNGIIVVNETYEVQQINPAAMKMLHIRSRSDVLGGPVIRILDPADFFDVLERGKRVVNKRDYYAEYDKFLELTIVNDKTSGNLIAIFRDVTDEEKERQSKEEMSRQTVETADRVVEKQMRIVQEIASLLGETAAETKIALTKLKESISNEDGK